MEKVEIIVSRDKSELIVCVDCLILITNVKSLSCIYCVARCSVIVCVEYPLLFEADSLEKINGQQLLLKKFNLNSFPEDRQYVHDIRHLNKIILKIIPRKSVASVSKVCLKHF